MCVCVPLGWNTASEGLTQGPGGAAHQEGCLAFWVKQAPQTSLLSQRCTCLATLLSLPVGSSPELSSNSEAPGGKGWMQHLYF